MRIRTVEVRGVAGCLCRTRCGAEHGSDKRGRWDWSKMNRPGSGWDSDSLVWVEPVVVPAQRAQIPRCADG